MDMGNEEAMGREMMERQKMEEYCKKLERDIKEMDARGAHTLLEMEGKNRELDRELYRCQFELDNKRKELEKLENDGREKLNELKESLSAMN